MVVLPFNGGRPVTMSKDPPGSASRPGTRAGEEQGVLKELSRTLPRSLVLRRRRCQEPDRWVTKNIVGRKP